MDCTDADTADGNAVPLHYTSYAHTCTKSQPSRLKGSSKEPVRSLLVKSGLRDHFRQQGWRAFTRGRALLHPGHPVSKRNSQEPESSSGPRLTPIHYNSPFTPIPFKFSRFSHTDDSGIPFPYIQHCLSLNLPQIILRVCHRSACIIRKQ